MDINKKMVEELKHLANMRDEDIDYSGIPEITDFTGWEPNPFFKPIKAPVGPAGTFEQKLTVLNLQQ
jgi:hypothetical protein